MPVKRRRVAEGVRLELSFCPTGPGGGRDPSCKPGGGGFGPTKAAQSGKKTEALKKTQAAKQATEKAINAPPQERANTHQEAAQAHREAAASHKAAGNESHANAHEHAAKEHSGLFRSFLRQDLGLLKDKHGSHGGHGSSGGGGGGMGTSKKKRPVKLSFAGDPGYELSFCPTGPGGGRDPSCSAHEASQAAVAASKLIPKKDQPYDASDRNARALQHSEKGQHYGAAKLHGLLAAQYMKESRFPTMRGEHDKAGKMASAARLHEVAANLHRALDKPADPGYRLAFCPTGAGGGTDNSCGGKGGGGKISPKKGADVGRVTKSVDMKSMSKEFVQHQLAANAGTSGAKEKALSIKADMASLRANAATEDARVLPASWQQGIANQAHHEASVAHYAAAKAHGAAMTRKDPIAHTREAAYHLTKAQEHAKKVPSNFNY